MSAHWLVKSEPDTWSWDQHVKKGVDVWAGVRNHQAKANLKAMKKGDLVFVYHTGDEKAIVGLAEISKENFPDPKDGECAAVELSFKKKFKTTMTLASVKADKKLSNMKLVKAARLSVQPVTPAEWAEVCRMGGLDPKKIKA